MLKVQQVEKLTWSLIIFAFAIAIVFYPYMPDWMATHWDDNDIPNKFLPKVLALFVVPMLTLIFLFLFKFIANSLKLLLSPSYQHIIKVFDFGYESDMLESSHGFQKHKISPTNTSSKS